MSFRINIPQTNPPRATPFQPRGETLFSPIPPNPMILGQIEFLTHVSNTPILLTWLTQSAPKPHTPNGPPGGVLGVLAATQIQIFPLEHNQNEIH